MPKLMFDDAAKAMLAKAQSQLTDAEFAMELAQAAVLPIAEQMIEDSFARKTFQIDRFSDGPTKKYQRKARQRGLILPRYGDAPQQIVRYPWILVTPFDYEVHPEIHMADLLDAQFDAAADILNDAGREMAVKEDQSLLSLLDAGIPNPGAVAPAVPTYNSATGVFSLPSGVDPQAGDLLFVQGQLRNASYHPDTILLNPVQLGKLMAEQAFLLWYGFGSREVQETGMLKNALGMKIVWSPLVDVNTIWVFDSNELARIVEREPLTVQPELKGRMMKWLVFQRSCPFVRNMNSARRIRTYNL